MNTLLVYMIKAAAYLAAFYLVYSLMLSRDTTYGRNRAFILISLTISLLFPLISFQTLKPHNIQFFGKFLSEVFVTADYTGNAARTSTPISGNIIQGLYSIYISGVVIFSIKFILDLFNLVFLILHNKRKGNNIITFKGFNTAGFSGLGYIFINSQLSDEEADEIIRHEQNHLNKNHFIDIIFIEIIKAVQWFNPAVHLFNRSLRAIHEYQADQGCLNSGMPVHNYQSLLLSQVFKSRAFNLSNSFSNPSLIKKRMIMMTKKRTAAIANMKLLLAIPAAGIVFLAISAYKEAPAQSELVIPGTLTARPGTEAPSSEISNSLSIAQSEKKENISTNKETNSSNQNTVAENPEAKKEVSVSTSAPPPPPPPTPLGKIKESDANSPEPFVVVEEMPMFPGGDRELLKYIGDNTVYPKNAKEKNIQGRVIIRFCVTETGGINKISVLKGVDPELDAEATRVVETLPAFKPGKQGGKAVPVWYMVPITFTLK